MIAYTIPITLIQCLRSICETFFSQCGISFYDSNPTVSSYRPEFLKNRTKTIFQDIRPTGYTGTRGRTETAARSWLEQGQKHLNKQIIQPRFVYPKDETTIHKYKQIPRHKSPPHSAPSVCRSAGTKIPLVPRTHFRLVEQFLHTSTLQYMRYLLYFPQTKPPPPPFPP